MSGESSNGRFAAGLDRLPGSAETAALRAAALKAFSATGFPTRRNEQWRYTDLAPLSSADLDFAPQPPAEELISRVAAMLDEASFDPAAPRLVFIDGGYCETLSRTGAAAGLSIASLASCGAADVPARAHAALDGHPLATLNAALVSDGAVIAVADGAEAPAALIELIFVAGGQSDLAAHPRVMIDVGRDAELTLVQHVLDLEAASGWFNVVTEIVQAPGSTLTLYRLQDHGKLRFHTALLRAELAEDAKLACGWFDLGGQLVRNDFDIRLEGPGAEADLYGIFLASSGQHTDNHIRMDHIAPRTKSGEAFRGIIGDRGHGVFNGKVVVHRDAQHIDARQSSDNLLLADNAEIDTKPELEIYADDVKCSHGATIGEIDEEQLFYLRARGLDEDEARDLLTFAFANAVLERVELPELRERIADRVAVHLADGEASGEHP